MMKLLDRLLKTVAALSGLALAGGLAGALHPAGDSLAVFRVPLLVVFALAVIWTDWPRLLRWPLVAGALLLLAQMVVRSLPGSIGANDIVLYQQNLQMDRRDSADWLDAVAEIGPDILTLQEVGVPNLPILRALETEYPSQHHCPVGHLLGEAVLSHFPKVPGSGFCSTRDGVAGMQVETPAGPLWVLSLHVSWPWPHDQQGQIRAILPEISGLEGPMVLAGDFNMVAWGHALRMVEEATGTRRSGQLTHTFTLPGGLPVGIDHMLATPGLGQGVRVLPGQGSDHRGLLGFLRLRGG